MFFRCLPDSIYSCPGHYSAEAEHGRASQCLVRLIAGVDRPASQKTKVYQTREVPAKANLTPPTLSPSCRDRPRSGAREPDSFEKVSRMRRCICAACFYSAKKSCIDLMVSSVPYFQTFLERLWLPIGPLVAFISSKKQDWLPYAWGRKHEAGLSRSYDSTFDVGSVNVVRATF